MNAIQTQAHSDYPTFSPEKRAVLLALPIHRTLTATADAVGIERSTVWRWATDGTPTYDPEFGIALQQVKQQVADEVEATLLEQAVSGRTAWDTTARIFYLKMARPEYRDTLQVNATHTVNVTHSIADLDTADQLSILALMQRRLIAPTEGGDVVEADFTADDEGTTP